MKRIKKISVNLAYLFGAGAAIITALNVFADPPPALSISSLGSNQFSIVITNAVTNVNYVLYSTPVLGDAENYPWILLSIGDLGQSNWIVDGGELPFSFFRVVTGNDFDGDGVVNWQDADPL